LDGWVDIERGDSRAKTDGRFRKKQAPHKNTELTRKKKRANSLSKNCKKKSVKVANSARMENDYLEKTTARMFP